MFWRVWPNRLTALRRTAQNFALFFPLPPHFSLFLPFFVGVFFETHENAEQQSTVVHRSTHSHRPEQVGEVSLHQPPTSRRADLQPKKKRRTTWRKRPTTFWSTASSTPRMRICAAGTVRLLTWAWAISSMKLRASELHRPESDNHETTPLCCDEFGISGFLVTCLGQDGIWRGAPQQKVMSWPPLRHVGWGAQAANSTIIPATCV